MEKMDMMSMDRVQENIAKIRALFPECVTEVMRDGKVTLAVDFDELKQEMSGMLIDEREERYQMTWPDKRKAKLLANTSISATLRPCKEESVDFDNTQNLYIEGDNLDVLKLLQETYLGKVKMIYIDPPYNTGSDFVYEDDFAQSAEEYVANSGQYDDQGNRLVENNETNGRFHTKWLNMIYPRLMVARDLLSDDGVIFISIDDNEQENLKKLCNEVFGESNYVCPFIWEKTQHFGRQKLNNYCNNDYILCYAKNLYSDKLKELLVENIKTELQDAPLYNASNNISTLHFPVGCTTFNVADGVYTTTTSNDYELLNPVIVENGKNKNAFSLRFRSRWSNATVQTEILKGTTFWVKTTSFAIRAIYGGNRHSTDAPRQIIFTNSSNPMATKSRFNNRIDTSENASNQLAILMDGAYFSYPKPVSLIEYFITLLYNEKKEDYENDCIVVDFFSGSATTAHAVMQLNAEDGGHRKFIMVQLPEKCDEKSEAYKAGYKNICEIGKERIRRAGKKIKEDSPLTTQDLDVGFRVLKLDSSNMKDVYYKAEDYAQTMIAGLEDNVKEDRTPLDLLFQVMLDLGQELSAKIEEKTIAGKTVWCVEGNNIIACFDSDINDQVVTEIAKLKPLYAVFRDSSFVSDAAAANCEQIFASISPATSRKVI